METPPQAIFIYQLLHQRSKAAPSVYWDNKATGKQALDPVLIATVQGGNI